MHYHNNNVRRIAAIWAQRDWEHAARFHKEYSDLLDKVGDNPTLIEFLKKKIEGYEQHFPQLKDKK